MILLLTAGIMGITLFVLAKIAKRLGLRIKGKALALAGVLACAIACALPFVAPFLTEGYYLKLGALAVAAALLVTGYNAYLWKKDAKAAESADETAEGESKDARTAEETLAARTRAAIGPQRFKWEPPDEPEEEPAEPEPEPAPKPEPVQKTESEPKPEPEPEQKPEPEEVPKKAPDEVKEAKPEKPPEKKEEPIKKAEQKPIEKISEPPQKEAPVLQAEPPSQRGEGRLRQGESPVQQDKKQDVSSAGATTKTEPAKPQAPIEKPEPKPIEKPEPEPKEPAPDFSTFTTLDDYLDYADAAQKKGDLERATTAYANAVDIYVSDPYIIYLYMDLGNLLKQQARYTDCINVYHAALSIPILAENPAIAHEFEKNIRYLEIVQAVLKRHHAEGTPFGDIPDAVRAEIEAADRALEKKSASKDETS
ncbi:hypothetical protein [uncultured Selenomonas sp.]|uniref:hypothetical protein n=1 Tax=uncultured Selenomonas sp. TaxID=159275 RepID=UPI0025DFD286|nr:hypothetical protein [uncultured Selenomonas sp.]